MATTSGAALGEPRLAAARSASRVELETGRVAVHLALGMQAVDGEIDLAGTFGDGYRSASLSAERALVAAAGALASPRTTFRNRTARARAGVTVRRVPASPPRPPIFDGHNDALLSSWRTGRDLLARSDEGQLDLPRAREGGLAAGLFAVFVAGGRRAARLRTWCTRREDGWAADPRPAVAHERGRAGRRRADRSAAAAGGRLGRARCASCATRTTLDRCLAGEALGAVLHLEGAEPIDPELRALEPLVERGVRSLGLVWSRPNAFGEGVPFASPRSPDTGPGLTAAGRRLVRACNELGVLVDLSHLNEAGFRDVAGCRPRRSSPATPARRRCARRPGT